MNKVVVAEWSKLADRAPAYALVANVDLVVIRYGDAGTRCCTAAAFTAARCSPTAVSTATT